MTATGFSARAQPSQFVFDLKKGTRLHCLTIQIEMGQLKTETCFLSQDVG